MKHPNRIIGIRGEASSYLSIYLSIFRWIACHTSLLYFITTVLQSIIGSGLVDLGFHVCLSCAFFHQFRTLTDLRFCLTLQKTWSRGLVTYSGFQVLLVGKITRNFFTILLVVGKFDHSLPNQWFKLFPSEPNFSSVFCSSSGILVTLIVLVISSGIFITIRNP